MAEEKTLPASEHKLREARRKGQVASSRDFTAAVGLLALLGVLNYQASSIRAALESGFRTYFALVGVEPVQPTLLLTALGRGVGAALAAIAAILLAAFLAGVIGPLVQVGPMLTFEPLRPKLDKLNPVAGFKRIFLSLKSYVEVFKGAIKIVIAALIVYATVRPELRELALVGRTGVEGVVALAASLIVRCAWRVAMFFFAVAIVDVLYQRWQFARDMRMSAKEQKDEYKQQEGDPEHKAARRRLHEEIATSNMLESVRQADVIVTNPDHVAAALRFDPEKEDAPRVVGKGAGHVAERIKQIAEEEGIPIVQNIPLAQALNKLETDAVIPEDLYEAAREVLLWVQKLAESQGREVRWGKRDKSE